MVEDVMAKREAPFVRDASADQGGGPRTERSRRLGGWWALLAALAAGGTLYAAFPPLDQWWAAPIGVALLAAASFRRGFWAGAALGLVAGLAFFVPLLSWAGYHVGWVWLYLPAAEALYFALLGGLAARASSLIDRWRWTWPLVTGLLWVLQEALRDRTPFGGFPWGRLAFSQGDSPLLNLASIGGAPLVTFAVAVLGGLLIWTPLVFAAVWSHEQESVRARALIPLGAIVLVFIAALAVAPRASTPHGADDTSGGQGSGTSGRSVTVAVVQGNVPRLGLEFNAQRRAVLDNHVNATLELARDLGSGGQPRPDVVIWPENASDIDPILNADAGTRIDQAVEAIGVPILVGGLLEGPGTSVRNVGIVWEPGQGPGQTYVKRHPVPFAEYMPIRQVARALTDKADLVRSDFVAGPEPGVLTLGPIIIGDVICFEVAYDEVVRDTVTGGAELLVVQTNNATFDEAEARQQLAMVRLRAVEHGRSAVMASTVGVSAVVDATGTVLDATPFNTPAIIVREVPLTTTRTIASELGYVPEVALVTAALGLLVVALVTRRRLVPGARREEQPAPQTGRSPADGEVTG